MYHLVPRGGTALLKNGIKDFDVWTFFREHPQKPFPYRRNKAWDFGDPRFGKTQGKEGFIGRRVDILGRSIKYEKKDDSIDALRRYLSTASTETARRLAQKAVILLSPHDKIGNVVWPMK